MDKDKMPEFYKEHPQFAASYNGPLSLNEQLVDSIEYRATESTDRSCKNCYFVNNNLGHAPSICMHYEHSHYSVDDMHTCADFL